MMKRVYAADIRPGDQIVDYFRVVRCRLAPYRDEHKGHYLHLVLADRTGQVEARLWEQAEQAARWLAPGQIVHIQARAAVYRDRIRLRVAALRPAGEDELDLSEFLAVPSVDAAEAVAALHGAIDQIHEPALRSLLEGLFGDPEFVEAFSLAPAGQPGLLLARTVQLLELAGPVVRLAPQLDADLLVAGILLHNIGLTASLADGHGGQALALLGAARLSDQLVVERLAQMPDFPPELALRLRHLLLSAADPASAQTAEAEVLARLGMLQAALMRE